MSFAIDPVHLRALRSAARAARDVNYTPYSKFIVLAAAETSDGHIFGGSNVEIANYSLTKHAEEVAVLHALASMPGLGSGWLKTLYIAGGAPCGSCRQFAYEFGDEATTIVLDRISQVHLRARPILDLEAMLPDPDVWRLGDLLPAAFGPRDLASVDRDDGE